MSKRVFNFTNYDVPIEIAGQEFTLNCSSDTGDYLKSVSNEMRELAIAYGKGEKTKDDLIAFGKEKIDHLLGAGAAEKILAGRKNVYSDITDILAYLIQVASDFFKERKNIILKSGQKIDVK